MRRAGPALACALVLAVAACQTDGPLPQASATQAELAVVQPSENWLTRGWELLNAGESELAVEAFERSLLTDGPSAAAMTGIGIAAERQGLVTMAARYFTRARDLDPDSELVHNNLGVVLYRLKEYYPARQAFQAAFALSSGRNDLALRNLRLVEGVIADLEAGRRYVDPAVNMEVRRLGTYEFELVDFEPRAPDYRIGGPEQPAGEDAVPEAVEPVGDGALPEAADQVGEDAPPI